MISAQLVGSVLSEKLDEKLLGSLAKKFTHQIGDAAFLFRVAKAARSVKKSVGHDMAEEIAEAVREAVPVDTGKLRDSVRVVPNEGGAVLIEGGTPETMKPIREGGPAIFDQALGIEYGTTERPAHPHFWPALRRYEKQIERVQRDALESEFG